MKTLFISKTLLGLALTLSTAIAGAQAASRPTTTDQVGIPEVLMGEVLVTQAAAVPQIQTYGASTCVILSLWDPVTKMGSLAHISAPIWVAASLLRLTNEFEFRGIPKGRLQARLVGGWKGWSENIVGDISTSLAQSGISIVEKDVLAEGPKRGDGMLLPTTPSTKRLIQDVTLDLRTGQLLNYEETTSKPTAAPVTADTEQMLHMMLIGL